MGPVAAAAKRHGMVYGLWFEPERVVAGTELHQDSTPIGCSAAATGRRDTYLLNFGLPEGPEYFFGIVKGFMELPGFRFYRQDFNMDPLAYWRHNDAPDRQGITEMKYIEGLYAFWDRIAEAWPDGLREECASGGRRIDLETVKRMHIHQKSDYWFDNEVDQASALEPEPVTCRTTCSPRRSCGWTTTRSTRRWPRRSSRLDRRRAEASTGAGRSSCWTRTASCGHLLVGAWYPLLPYSRDGRHWMASQFHRPDLGEGMVLVVPPLRRPSGPSI